MPRYLYGGSYDSIASQEMGRDSARDQRYFQSIVASQRLRQQMEDELYRKAQFEAAQRQAQQQFASQNEARNLQALLQMQELKANQQRNAVVDQRENRRIDLQETAQQAAERRFQEQMALKERELRFKQNTPNFSRQMLSAPNMITLIKERKRQQELEATAAQLADVSNRAEQAAAALAQVNRKGEDYDKLRAQKNDYEDQADELKKKAGSFVIRNPTSGLWESTYQTNNLAPESIMQRMRELSSGGGFDGGGGGSNAPSNLPIPVPSAPTNAPPSAPQMNAPRNLPPPPPQPRASAAPSDNPTLPPGATVEDVMRDAQLMIEMGHPPAEVARVVWETFRVQIF